MLLVKRPRGGREDGFLFFTNKDGGNLVQDIYGLLGGGVFICGLRHYDFLSWVDLFFLGGCWGGDC